MENENNEYDDRLVTLTLKCAEETELPCLSCAVCEALFALPHILIAGVAVFDEERQCVQRYVAFQTPSCGPFRADPRRPIQEDELPADATELSVFLNGSKSYHVVDPNRGLPTLLNGHAQSDGITSYLSAPIRLRGQLLGVLFAASSDPGRIPEQLLTTVARLARAVTPVLYNCLNHTRFARGDRRRDALIELSHVINSSLELETVLTHARRVIRSLEGHCMSAICLLNDGNRTYQCYRNIPSSGSETPTFAEPTVHQVSASVVAWLLKHGTRYESEDLEQDCRYEDEHEFRKQGVRRYLAIPLLARGRILGAFMFGTQDARPRRKVEYWLYENIAMQLALAIDNAVKHGQLQHLTRQLSSQNAYLQKEIRTEQGFGAMVGATPAVDALRADILQVAGTDATVLITGETGVGKELVARNIHEHSTRAGQPFIKVNCPSIPEGMIESELFGHERGAFTSAVERRIGRFELAHDGTIFLDEIGELSLPFQAKLLRILQDGEFERVGGSKTLATNARIIVATNRDLPKAIENGTFRADLFFRINVFPIVVPPLRQRRKDIPLLAQAFLTEFGQRLGKRMERIDEKSLAELCRRYWAGNIRELRHVIERAVILASGPCLEVEPATSILTPERMGQTDPVSNPLTSLDAVQAEHIRRTLTACGGIIEGDNGAAARLGLKPSTLRFRMKRLGIERSERGGNGRPQTTKE